MKVDKILNLSIIIVLLLILMFNLKSLPVLIAILMVTITIIAIRKFDISNKSFVILIIATTLITHLICILKVNNPQFSDFKTLFDISEDLLDGSLNESNQNYLNTWPYQTPFVLYQTLLLKICNSETFLKIFNAIINVCISLLIYNISKKVSDKRSAQIVTILYLFFINKILYGNILTNQFPQILFLLLGLNIFLSDKLQNEKIKISFFAICAGISNLFRPEGIIILLSFICYELYKLIKEKKYINTIINVLLFVFIYLIISKGTMLLLNKTLIKESNDIGILYKIVLGLDIDSGGKWSPDGFNKLFSFNNRDNLISYEKEQIIKSISDIRIFRLFMLKINTFWNHLDMTWTLNYLQNKNNVLGLTYSTFYEVLSNYDSTIWLIIILFSIIGFKEKNNKSILLNIIIIANFAVYLLIEVQGRYSVFSRILLFILASKGIKELLKRNKLYNIVDDLNQSERDVIKND